jgi:VanZ family protein
MIGLKKYWLTILFVIVIIILCFINPPEMETQPMTNFDKLAHFLMFMGLSGTMFFDNSFYFKKQVARWSIFWGSFLFPIVFSGGIEIAQEYLTTTRSGDWMDFLFDTIGVSCGCLICLGINRKLNPQTGW